MSDDELDVIERRCSAATNGPWKSYFEGRDHFGGDSFIKTGAEDLYISPWRIEDQDFIAHARQDIPALIRQVKALRSELASKA